MEAVAGVVDGADRAQAAVGVDGTTVSVVLVRPVGPVGPGPGRERPEPGRAAEHADSTDQRTPTERSVDHRDPEETRQRTECSSWSPRAWRAPSTSTHVGPPKAALSTTSTSAPGRRPSCTKWASAGVS